MFLRSVGRMDMTDKSMKRIGVVVLLKQGRFSRLISESCPISWRLCTGLPGRSEAAVSGEPRKEERWVSAVAGI